MSVGELHVPIAELGERIAQEFTITDWRAVVMVVVAVPGLEGQAEAACDEPRSGSTCFSDINCFRVVSNLWRDARHPNKS